MDVQVKTRDVRLTDALQDHIDEQVKKLERVDAPVIDAKLELRSIKNRSGGEQITAQFTIQTKRRILRTEEHHKDVKVAIDTAVARMERQIRRFHDKNIFTQRRKKQAHVEQVGVIHADTPVEDGTPEPLPVDEIEGYETPIPIRHKRFPIMPMDEGEAIEQMELLGHDFFVYFNPEDEQVNVLYRRKDGEYGVIQPELA